MKYSKNLYILILSIITIGSVSAQENSINDQYILTTVQSQYELLLQSVKSNNSENKIVPRTIKDGKTVIVSAYDWTSGFFPGSLWYIYDLTKNKKWKNEAVAFTEKLDTMQYWKNDHDVGFIMECSYGNALKNESSEAYDKIIVQTAKSLITRFRPKAGILQSWNAGEQWDCPVIIDNMMNLELLFHASKISNDATYYNIAVSHADTTLKNHFRSDYSSYHVLNYDTKTGEVLDKNTHQGYADSSAWARGQAWGLYGYTMTYRETKDPKYLQQAIKIANYIMTNPNLPVDKIPYWDYDVPKTDQTPRDASAASITASALYKLSTFVEGEEKSKFINWANTIMKSLKSPMYFAKAGKNNGFLLYHSVGHIPNNSEVDVPINYADYYFLEALVRGNALNK